MKKKDAHTQKNTISSLPAREKIASPGSDGQKKRGCTCARDAPSASPLFCLAKTQYDPPEYAAFKNSATQKKRAPRLT